MSEEILMADEVRRAVLKCAPELRQQAISALPPEHRVVAEKPMLDHIELLIEGPTLPHVWADALPEVRMVLSVSNSYNDGPVTLHAWWAQINPVQMGIQRVGRPWLVKSWPTIEAYQADQR